MFLKSIDDVMIIGFWDTGVWSMGFLEILFIVFLYELFDMRIDDKSDFKFIFSSDFFAGALKVTHVLEN